MSEIHATRRERLCAELKSRGCSVCLITNFTNVSYLTGFTGDDSWLLLSKKGALLISDGRYATQIENECPDVAACIRALGKGICPTVSECLPQIAGGSKSVAIESDSMTVSTRDSLEAALAGSDSTLVPQSALVEKLREIKDASEIASIRAAIVCACRAFNVVRSGLRPSDTELNVRDELEYAMLRLGSEEKAFSSIIASGARAALPHACPIDQRVGDSEMLLIDWGAKIGGYVSDLTRVLVTRKRASAKFRRIYDTVLAAQRAAIEAIRPGAVCQEIDGIARKVIGDAGHGKAFNHGLGHGIGRVVHDRGAFRTGNTTVLKPGMVLTVEPGIYYPDWGGVRIEDDVLVTRQGCEVLSEGFPREFDEMVVDW